MSDKSLNPEQNERLREALREIVEGSFGGNKTNAAKKLGVSQSFVSEVLKGNRGAGNKLLAAMADFTGKSLDELSGRSVAGEPAGEVGGELPAYGAMPGYREAETEARKTARLPPSVFVLVRRMRGVEKPPSPMTPDFIARAAIYLWNELPLDERIRLEREFLESQMQRITTRAENAARRGKKKDTD